MRSAIWISSICGVLVIVLSVVYVLAPKYWPDGVVAYSPFFSQIIKAEARRWDKKPPLIKGPKANFGERVKKQQARALPALLDGLVATDDNIRNVAISGFDYLDKATINNQTTITALAQHATNSDEKIRALAIQHLALLDRHLNLVQDAINDSHAVVRRTAIQGLTPKNDVRYLPAFAHVCEHDKAKGVRRDALMAVAEISHPDAIPWLFQFLARNERDDIEIAGGALAKRTDLSPEQRQQLMLLVINGLKDDVVAWNAYDAYRIINDYFKDDAIQYLEKTLQCGDHQAEQLAAWLLRSFAVAPSDQLIATTIAGLKYDNLPFDNVQKRYSYFYNELECTLWLLKNPDLGTEQLRAALQSADSQQRFLAAWLLGMRSDQQSLVQICQELIPRLRDDSARGTATWAIRSLYKLGPEAAPYAEAALFTADEQQMACLRLLLRNWVDPPKTVAEAAARGRVPLSVRYHDPAWEPSIEKEIGLPSSFVRISETVTAN